MGAVGELALVAVGTEPVLHELFAELEFLLGREAGAGGVGDARGVRGFGGGGVAVLEGGQVGLRVVVSTFSKH